MRLPNGYGSVIKLGGKRRKPFAARVTTGYIESGLKNGVLQYKQQYKYVGYFEKRKDALNALNEYNKNPNIFDNNKITLNEIYDAWSKRKFEKLSKNSIRNYNVIYKKLEAFYNEPFCALNVDILQKIIDDNSHLSNVKQIKVLLGQLYAYAMERDIVNKDYSQFIEVERQAPKKPKKPFTQEEIETLWKNEKEPMAQYTLILLYTGARIFEILELRLNNIDLNNRLIFIEKSKTKNGIRYIPIHKKIMPFIEIAFKNNKEYLIEKENQQFLYDNFYRHHFTPYMLSLKMDHTPHDTRHTFISQCDRLKINKVIQKRIVGHASRKDVTDRYTHKTDVDLLEAIDIFNY